MNSTRRRQAMNVKENFVIQFFYLNSGTYSA